MVKEETLKEVPGFDKDDWPVDFLLAKMDEKRDERV
jgi:hypothetical protein